MAASTGSSLPGWCCVVGDCGDGSCGSDWTRTVAEEEVQWRMGRRIWMETRIYIVDGGHQSSSTSSVRTREPDVLGRRGYWRQNRRVGRPYRPGEMVEQRRRRRDWRMVVDTVVGGGVTRWPVDGEADINNLRKVGVGRERCPVLRLKTGLVGRQIGEVPDIQDGRWFICEARRIAWEDDGVEDHTRTIGLIRNGLLDQTATDDPTIKEAYGAE